MYHTKERFFALRTISLLGSEIIILKAMPITDKSVFNLCSYTPSQEIAVNSTVRTFGVVKSHTKMYDIKDKDGFIEVVYRRKYL